MSLNPTTPAPVDAALGQSLAQEAYLRDRQTPRRRDGDYLILCDVRRIVRRYADQMQGSVFDYGCGGAPYRALFAHCNTYVRADVLSGPYVDRLLGQDGMTSEADGSHDWVFSTQVLEHVPEPARYLEECRRILRDGGNLLLTTHGFYPEHGCPDDFQRWTAEGLARCVGAAGLEVVAAGKLTGGVRGAVQLLHHCVWNLRSERRGMLSFMLGAFRKAYGWWGVPVLNLFADGFQDQAVLAATSAPSLYVGIYVHARKHVARQAP